MQSHNLSLKPCTLEHFALASKIFSNRLKKGIGLISANLFNLWQIIKTTNLYQKCSCCTWFEGFWLIFIGHNLSLKPCTLEHFALASKIFSNRLKKGIGLISANLFNLWQIIKTTNLYQKCSCCTWFEGFWLIFIGHNLSLKPCTLGHFALASKIFSHRLKRGVGLISANLFNLLQIIKM